MDEIILYYLLFVSVIHKATVCVSVAIKFWMIAISCLSDRLKLAMLVTGELLIFSLGDFRKIVVSCVLYPLPHIYDYRGSCIKTSIKTVC